MVQQYYVGLQCQIYITSLLYQIYVITSPTLYFESNNGEQKTLSFKQQKLNRFVHMKFKIYIDITNF